MRECLANVRERKPLIHNITNYVTINDVANALLACGGSPIMAEAAEEAKEITAGCDGLNLNIGMLNAAKAQAMELAGVRAQKEGHVILLDPVGIGASVFRRETVKHLMEKIQFTAIRGNISEIRALVEMLRERNPGAEYEKNDGADVSGEQKNAASINMGSGMSRGVDAVLGERVTEENVKTMAEFAKIAAALTGSIIAVTGSIDLVADKKDCYIIRNGRPEMSCITGTGCQLSGMMTAFLAANPKQPLKAAAAAVCCMGLAGEAAWEHMRPEDGNATYRNRIIDAISRMEGEALEKGAKYEIC